MRAGASVLAVLGAAVFMSGGCEIDDSQSYHIVAGPTVPSPVPTNPPYVWDTREELDIWVNNPATRGPVPISLVGEGQIAFIRIEKKSGVDGWVLRGPNLTTPARIRGLRLSYRWTIDPNLSPAATRTFTLNASFDVLNASVQPQQPNANAQLQPAVEWTDANLNPGLFRGEPLEVRYAYLHQYSSNPGVFEIDRIELVQ